MKIINNSDVKTNLSKLFAQAASGEPFIVAKYGKPLVKVISSSVQEGKQMRRLGFMSNQIFVSEDFDHQKAFRV